MKLFTSFLVVVGTWTTATAFSARRTTRSSRRTNRPLLMAASSSSSRREVLTTTGGAAAAVAIASGWGVLTPAVASAASITKQSAANRANESYQGVVRAIRAIFLCVYLCVCVFPDTVFDRPTTTRSNCTSKPFIPCVCLLLGCYNTALYKWYIYILSSILIRNIPRGIA